MIFACFIRNKSLNSNANIIPSEPGQAGKVPKVIRA